MRHRRCIIRMLVMNIGQHELDAFFVVGCVGLLGMWHYHKENEDGSWEQMTLFGQLAVNGCGSTGGIGKTSKYLTPSKWQK